MFEDYEGLKTIEQRAMLIRFASAFICAAVFPFCKFFIPAVAYSSLLVFAVWYLVQWPLLRRQTDFRLLQRWGRFNFFLDFLFVTLIVINNGSDLFWAAYTIYVLEGIAALILFGVRGGLVTTIVAFGVTAGVSFYRVYASDLHEPLYAAFSRLALVLVAGLFSTYTLSGVWVTTRQSARTGALNELNRNLIASESMTETQLYRRLEAAVRSLMRADGFLLALLPIPSDFELPHIPKIQPDDLLPAIVTANNQLLPLDAHKQSWQGNPLVRQCLVEHGLVQKYVANPPALSLPDYQRSKLPWFAQYNVWSGVYLYTPLEWNGKLLGLIGVQKKTRRLFDINNVALFEQLATLCATALHNVRLTNSQHRRISELALLNQISFDLAHTVELTALVTTVRLRLLEFFVASNVRFVLKLTAEEEPEPDLNLKIGSLEGITDTGLRQPELNLLHTLMQRKENLLSGDLSHLPVQLTDMGANSQNPLRGSYAAVSLVAENEVLGILAVHHSQANRYFANDLQLLETIAHQTSTVIHNLRLQRQTVRNLEEVRELYHILKSQEGELRREAEERARFEGTMMTARAISHEIGQPLTAILGLVSLARSGARLTGRDLEILEHETLLTREIIAKLRSVVRFEVKPYADQTPMLDLEASSRPYDLAHSQGVES